MYPVTVRAYGDETNPWPQPAVSSSGQVVLEPAETVIGQLTATSLSIHSQGGAADITVLDLDDTLVEISVTQHRVFYRCVDVGDLAGSGTTERVESSVVVGHLRYPWVAEVAGSAKRRRRDRDSLILRGRTSSESGVELVTIRFELDPGADPDVIAADITRRVARFRLGEPGLDPGEEGHLRELAEAKPLRSAKGQYATHTLPTFYPLGGGEAIFAVVPQAGSGEGPQPIGESESLQELERAPVDPSMAAPLSSIAPERVPMSLPQYGSSFPTAIRRGFRKFASFSGRSSRSEFWWWALLVSALWLVLGSALVFAWSSTVDQGFVVLVAGTAVVVACLLPTLAVAVRRLHDTGRSGWFLLIALVPVLGWLVVLVLLASSTTPAAVRFDPSAAEPLDAQPVGPTSRQRMNSPIVMIIAFALVILAAGTVAMIRKPPAGLALLATPLSERSASGGSRDEPAGSSDPRSSNGPSSSAGARTPATSPAPPGSAPGPPSPQPPTTKASQLPQSAEPLAANVMVTRRNDGGDWRIETVATNGRRGSVLVTGRENRAAVLTPDRRTVLYLQELSGSVTLRAVSADGYDDQALFSDGTSACPRLGQPAINRAEELVVSCLEAPSRPGVLVLMRLDGTVVRTLDRGRLGDPTFTRDGASVVYWRAKGPATEGGSIYRTGVTRAGKPVRVVAGAEGEFDDPVCSPTADRLAMTQKRGQASRIVTLDLANGSQPRPLAASTSASKGPSWSPDGSELAFRAGNDEQASVLIAGLSGAKAREMFANDGYLAAPLWTAH